MFGDLHGGNFQYFHFDKQMQMFQTGGAQEIDMIISHPASSLSYSQLIGMVNHRNKTHRSFGCHVLPFSSFR